MFCSAHEVIIFSLSQIYQRRLSLYVIQVNTFHTQSASYSLSVLLFGTKMGEFLNVELFATCDMLFLSSQKAVTLPSSAHVGNSFIRFASHTVTDFFSPSWLTAGVL